MPIILVVIGLIAAVSLGGYFWKSHEIEENAITPVVTTTTPVTSTPSETTPTETPVETKPVTTPTETKPAVTPSEPVTAPVTKTTYKDADYSVKVAYNAPDRLEHGVTVKLTLKNDIVTASDVIFDPSQGATANYQKGFAAAYKIQVIGKTLDSINLARVGGASLTSNAWNNAKAQIAAQAKS